MPRALFNNLEKNLKLVCELFDEICSENNLNYIIESNNDDQIFVVSGLDKDTLNFLYNEAANFGVLVEYSAGKLAIKSHPIVESNRQFFNVGDFDPEAITKMENCAIEYLGERLRGPFSNIFRGMSLPVRIANVESVWQTHMTDDKWDSINNNSCDWPIVLDTVTVNEEESTTPGRLVDGRKRLYNAYKKKLGLIEYLDIKDVLTEAQKYITEDQYRWSSRRQIQNQSSFPQSMSPSRSFGGISGYKRIRRKRHMKEYEQNICGKLTGDLVAHDRSTIIPAGSMIRIVDHDPNLPDIEFEGRIINVDQCNLDAVFKPTPFSEQLDRAFINDDTKSIVDVDETAFENNLSEAFSTISIVEPDILMTVNQHLDDKVIEEVLKKENGEWILASRKTGEVLRKFGKEKPSEETMAKVHKKG